MGITPGCSRGRTLHRRIMIQTIVPGAEDLSAIPYGDEGSGKSFSAICIVYGSGKGERNLKALEKRDLLLQYSSW